MAKQSKQTTQEFIVQNQIYNVWSVFKSQSLMLMHDLCNNHILLPYFPLDTNSTVHEHFTRSNTNLHITHITSLDKRNFVYNCTIEWNACPPESRNVTRTVFKNNIAHLICK